MDKIQRFDLIVVKSIKFEVLHYFLYCSFVLVGQVFIPERYAILSFFYQADFFKQKICNNIFKSLRSLSNRRGLQYQNSIHSQSTSLKLRQLSLSLLGNFSHSLTKECFQLHYVQDMKVDWKTALNYTLYPETQKQTSYSHSLSYPDPENQPS